MKIYVASKSCHWPWWSALRSLGLPISASWLDWPPNHDGSEPTQDEWSAHWERCCREAASADITLMFANGEERQLGALIEIGCGKQVFVVSPHTWSFQHHPRVRWFDTIAEAVTAIMATAAGVRARRAA